MTYSGSRSPTDSIAALERSAAAAKSRYELLLAGTRPERLAQARAQLAEIDAQLREMQIVAPTNCVLEVLHVKAGDVLPSNREVATALFVSEGTVKNHVTQILAALGVRDRTRLAVLLGRYGIDF